jgi:hypothetical protein
VTSDADTQESEIDWRAVIAQVAAGQAVEIPCETDADCVRQAMKAGRRAEKQGVEINVLPANGGMRLEPRDPNRHTPLDDARRDRVLHKERRLERHRRREARRAEAGESDIDG